MTDEIDTIPAPVTPLSPPTHPVEAGGEAQTDTEVLTFEELRGRHYQACQKMNSVIENDTSRTILELLVDGDGSGVSYGMVLDYVDVSRRYVKDRVYDLRDAGLVEVTDTGIALVRFVEDAYVVLATDILYDYYRV